jgi:hypothetical protein
MLVFERHTHVEDFAAMLEPSAIGFEVFVAKPDGYVFVLVHSPNTDRWLASYTLAPAGSFWKTLGEGLDCYGRPTFATRERAERACGVMYEVLTQRERKEPSEPTDNKAPPREV